MGAKSGRAGAPHARLDAPWIPRTPEEWLPREIPNRIPIAVAAALRDAAPCGADRRERNRMARLGPGLQEARKRNLPVLVDVYTDWCGWCKRMDRDVYAQPEVRDYLSRKFVTVKLDAEAARSRALRGTQLHVALARRALRCHRISHHDLPARERRPPGRTRPATSPPIVFCWCCATSETATWTGA